MLDHVHYETVTGIACERKGEMSICEIQHDGGFPALGVERSSSSHPLPNTHTLLNLKTPVSEQAPLVTC